MLSNSSLTRLATERQAISRLVQLSNAANDRHHDRVDNARVSDTERLARADSPLHMSADGRRLAAADDAAAAAAAAIPWHRIIRLPLARSAAASAL